MSTQMKVVGGSPTSLGVSAVERQHKQRGSAPQSRECWYCGKKHDIQYGKTCSKCRKPNHFEAKCRSASTPTVHPAEERDEVFPVAGGNLDDSQLVSLQLDSGCHIHFQEFPWVSTRKRLRIHNSSMSHRRRCTYQPMEERHCQY